MDARPNQLLSICALITECSTIVCVCVCERVCLCAILTEIPETRTRSHFDSVWMTTTTHMTSDIGQMCLCVCVLPLTYALLSLLSVCGCLFGCWCRCYVCLFRDLKLVSEHVDTLTRNQSSQCIFWFAWLVLQIRIAHIHIACAQVSVRFDLQSTRVFVRTVCWLNTARFGLDFERLRERARRAPIGNYISCIRNDREHCGGPCSWS